MSKQTSIRKSSPCDEYPHMPHFYIAKTGHGGAYLFVISPPQNTDPGYTLEPPRRGGSKRTQNPSSEQQQEKHLTFSSEISNFYSGKKLYITWACSHNDF